MRRWDLRSTGGRISGKVTQKAKSRWQIEGQVATYLPRRLCAFSRERSVIATYATCFNF